MKNISGKYVHVNAIVADRLDTRSVLAQLEIRKMQFPFTHSLIWPIITW